MIPIYSASEFISENIVALPGEKAALSDSVGRILGEDVLADSDLPPFDRSQMDGYVVKASDTQNAPVELKIVGESAAGRGWHSELRNGEAVRIMTGAPVPAGADAVQKIELTSEDGETVVIQKSVEPGKSIVRQADEVRKGDKVFAAGERITENMIAALASFGYASVTVARRPTVAILSTGSEIVELEQTPGRDQIRNSNSVMIDALARKFGGSTRILPIVGDDFEKLKSSVADALGTDIMIITGGVSVGKYDLTKDALHALGARIFFEKVRVKPGKPLVFAKLNDTLIFGLPGNPVSAAVTFYLFVRSAILQMQGASQTSLRVGTAVVRRAVRAAKERETFLPASLVSGTGGRIFAEPLKYGGSSDFIGFSRAEALIRIPQGASLDEGDAAEIYYL
jgi:molybdenum cofactor synthesis domain-containing protein